MTAGNAVDWDPIKYDAPRLGDASTAFCDGKKKEAAEADSANMAMQQRLDDDGTTTGMVSTLPDIANNRPIPERSTTPWCEFLDASGESSSSNKRLNTVERPRSSRLPRYIS